MAVLFAGVAKGGVALSAAGVQGWRPLAGLYESPDVDRVTLHKTYISYLFNQGHGLRLYLTH